MIPFADSALDRSMQDCSVWVEAFLLLVRFSLEKEG